MLKIIKLLIVYKIKIKLIPVGTFIVLYFFPDIFHKNKPDVSIKHQLGIIHVPLAKSSVTITKCLVIKLIADYNE